LSSIFEYCVGTFHEVYCTFAQSFSEFEERRGHHSSDQRGFRKRNLKGLADLHSSFGKVLKEAETRFQMGLP
jgi:hypothetical protein